jgi:hypothetical protein
MAAAENKAAELGATEISDSFLGAEGPEHASAYNHPGVPIVASAGDHGYQAKSVGSPASYPTVIAAGGTSLRAGTGRPRFAETVWYQGSGGEGTGSGCSHEPKPAWQTDGGCPFRTTNDISAVADPNTPVSVYDSYETEPHWLLLGGTSASAPIVAAAMALASPYTRSFSGARALYLDAAGGGGGFNDIVSGVNGSCGGSYLCEAGLGYDGPSGLGSLRGAPDLPPPTAVTMGASSIQQTEATLAGTVNSHGAEVHQCTFEYGPTSSYGSSAPCASLPSPATNPVPVSASIARLAAATVYHFRITVAYPGGPGLGSDQTFITLGNAPTVTTGVASSVALSSVTLNAQVNPNGAAISECEFEYGATATYGDTAPCTPSPGGGQAPVAVAAGLQGLTANATYHFRVVASNQYGKSHSIDQTVTLLPELPNVVTGAASAVTATSATLTATVDPNGAPLSTCEFEFNSSESDIPCAAMPGAQEAPVAVLASVHGLPAGAAFRYRIVAANASGTSYGAIQEFTSLPSVFEPPLEPAPAHAPSVHQTGYAADLAGTTIRVGSKGDFTVRVRCPVADALCSGTVTLSTLGAVRAAGHPPSKRTLTLARGSFSAARGSVVTVRMKLSARARRLLERLHVMRARATVLTGASAGPALASQTLTTLHAVAAAHTHRT